MLELLYLHGNYVGVCSVGGWEGHRSFLNKTVTVKNLLPLVGTVLHRSFPWQSQYYLWCPGSLKYFKTE